MSDDRLKEELAHEVLGWKVAPDRFIKRGRSWIPKWRFNPLDRLEDAFHLLDVVATRYRLEVCERGMFTAEVHIGSRAGKASGTSKARTITTAMAHALGLKLPDESSDPASMPPRRRNPQPRSKVDGT